MSNKLIRNRSTANKPETKLIDFKDLVKIVDKNAKQNAFKLFVNHLLTNNCNSNKCHDLCHVFTQLTANLVNLQNCDQQLDRLINEFDLIGVNDEQIVDKYLHLVYDSINLKPFKCAQTLENAIIPKMKGFKQFDGEDKINGKELEIFDKMHSFLSRIKISKFETNLLRIIERKFPFISGPFVVSVHTYVCYVYNMFKTYDYVSNKSKLLSLTFDKLLEIDSIVSLEKSNTSEDIFSIEDLNQSTDGKVNGKVDILDNLMLCLMQLIDSYVINKSKEETEEFFNLFKTIFPSLILNAETTNHLQYIWLYLSSLSNQFFEEFIQYLWDFGLNNENGVELREKAIYFISSLLKTANFIPITVVINFMNMCSLWIHRYIEENDRTPDQLTTEDNTFYILCQMLFNTFCSIHSDLDNLNLRRIKAMNFQRIIRCKLNPLEFCCRPLEDQFLSLARHYQIGYCPPNETSNENRLKRPTDLLNCNYILPKSVNKIQNLCKNAINIENNGMTEVIDKYNAFNTSDDSDCMIGSYKNNYSPSKVLWQNLLSDSSPNERMDFEPISLE